MLAFFLSISIFLTLAYATLIAYYYRGWRDSAEIITEKERLPSTFVSIIIPARNEAHNLPILLKAILSQYYPSHLMEIIVVDDHSTDETAEIARSYPGVICIELAQIPGFAVLNSYKKKAIETGIRQSKGSMILTTDADCIPGPYWILSMVEYFEKKNAVMIAGPVAFTNRGSWFEHFQSLDFLTMHGITAAVLHFKSGTMCNGANLAYKKSAFEQVGGFQGIDDIASGDDMLLMFKIEQAFPGQIAYLKNKDAIVLTSPMPDFRSFIEQRIRWASKATKFKDKRIFAVLLMVYFYNFHFILGTFLCLFYPVYGVYIFIALLIKILVESLLVNTLTSFFNKRNERKFFSILQLIHIPYIVVSGLLGQFGSYHWKGRKVK
jgi:cellulose synthase/poly-beta-1,6-N-acetylglucosamine synthase-like glycosyltransferase